MRWVDLFFQLSSSVVGHLVFVPLVGAVILLLCFRMLGVAGITFFQSWKVYLAAVSFGLILIVVLNLLMPRRQLGSVELLALQAGATCLTHLLVIGLLLRKFSGRALLAQGVVVLSTNLVAFTLMHALAAR
jgi:hypothetical protein